MRPPLTCVLHEPLEDLTNQPPALDKWSIHDSLHRSGAQQLGPEHLRELRLRAPLRDEHNSLSKVDTELAKKLFEKGEKSVVSEYLKLCESLANFKNYPDLYAVEKKA